MPKISVIIPTYNRSQLIQKAIQSVLDQTFKDIEIIVVDDASTENILAALAPFNNADIIYLRHETNKGGSFARNTGLKKARGEYIAFLDSDDFWLPTKLEKQLQLFQQGNEKLGLVYTAFEVNWSDHQLELLNHRGNIAQEILATNCIGTSSTPLIKKICFDNVGGFDESLPSCQDWDMWIRIAQQYEVDCIKELLVYYNTQATDSITANQQAWLRGRSLFLNKYAEKIKQLPAALKAEHYFYLAKSYRKKSLIQAILYFLKAVFYRPKLLMRAYNLVTRKLFKAINLE